MSQTHLPERITDMTSVTAESLTVDEALPARSRTFSPEVVKRISELLSGVPQKDEDGNTVTGDDGSPQWETAPVRNIGIGSFVKEGAARSALVTLNKLLHEHGHSITYAGTVRQTEDGKYKAVIVNKPAKRVQRTNGSKSTGAKKNTGKRAAA